MANTNNRKSNRQKLLSEIEDEEDRDIRKPTKFRLHQPSDFNLTNSHSKAEVQTPKQSKHIKKPHSVPAKGLSDAWDMPTSSGMTKRNEPYNWQEVLQSLPSTATPNKKQYHNHPTQRSQSQSATKSKPAKQTHQMRPRTNSLNDSAGLNWQQIQLTKTFNSKPTPSKSSNNIRKNLQQSQHRQKSDSAIFMLQDNAYAGAAFHNSPAPTDLPAPQFLK